MNKYRLTKEDLKKINVIEYIYPGTNERRYYFNSFDVIDNIKKNEKIPLVLERELKSSRWWIEKERNQEYILKCSCEELKNIYRIERLIDKYINYKFK